VTINRKRITAVVFVLTICGTSVSRAMGQQTSASRTQPPAVIKYDGDMAFMLAHLTDLFGVTIGLEVDPLQPKPQVGFYLRDPTLTDVLNAITRSAPRYQWRESGGIIEVLPLEGSSPLLDTIISNFRVTDVDEAVAINQLVNLPEVQASMRAMSLNRRDLGNASTERKGEKFSISLEGVTMRQALSRVAKENGARFWIFRTDSNGFFSINNSPR
jgi:hypothetical protein